MKTRINKSIPLFCLLLSTLSPQLSTVFAQPMDFTYQGRLDNSGAPYTGSAEFQPTLWDADSDGSQVAANNPATVTVGVTNGLFALPLDFGGNFPGADRWLQLEVKTAIGPFTLLSPRQQITATPYAITASNLTGTLPAAQLSGTVSSVNLGGTYSGAVTFNNAGNAFSGNGADLTSLNASQLTSGTVPDARLGANVARTDQVWLLGGNAGTAPGTHSVGTADNQPLELKVNGMRALRLEPTVNDATHSNIVNVVGGSSGNFVGAGAYGATIGGGGALRYMGSLARTNRVEADFGTVSGGAQNTIHTDAVAATIGGGDGNTIQTNASITTIGGGLANTIQPGAWYATIGGGLFNAIQTNALAATIGGGGGNTIQTNARYSSIGGGNQNTIQTIANFAAIGGGEAIMIQTNAFNSTVGGGYLNMILAHAFNATIGGGSQNTIQPNAAYATIPGGSMNSATNYAFAAGRRAKANHTGAFVWADSEDADFASQRNDQFRVRAEGGARFDFNEGEWVDLRYVSNPLVSPRIINTSSGAYLSSGGSWVNASDRASKTRFTPVDPQAVLAKVADLPLNEWSYRTEDETVRHVGPMAQDFHAAFGLGNDDKAIASVDADGVALAAVQGLNQKVEAGTQRSEVRSRKLEKRLQRKETEIAELKQRLEKLEQLFECILNGGAR